MQDEVRDGRGTRGGGDVQCTAVKAIPLEVVSEDYARRSIVGENVMISWAMMKAGAHARNHSHSNEQIIWVLSGAVEFVISERRHLCGKGDVVVIPPDFEHEARFQEDTEFLTILAPPRDDLRYGAPLPGHLKREG